jgi:hypothetical protein
MMANQKLWYLLIMLCVFRPDTKAQLTYKDVAPIFIQRCAGCHHQGKVFPYLTNYSSTSLYKGLISHDLQTAKMPPWPADTTYSRFAHERIIPQSEKTKVLNWLAAGAPSGDTTQAAVAPAYSVNQLSGTADMVLRIPNYVSTANYADKNVCFSFPTGLTQDRVLRAYEIVDGRTHIAHHVMMGVDTLGTSTTDLSGGCSVSSIGFILGGWAPGSPPVVFPGKDSVKFGITIKSGSRLVLQVHYPAGTGGLTDSTRIRLYFYPLATTGIRKLSTIPIKNSNFSIPPDSIVSVTGEYPKTGSTPKTISVFSIFPHSHKICTSIDNYASNGIDTIAMCRINHWAFEWQGFYAFQHLLKVPTGFKLYGKHVYDNTTANPDHSPLTVVAGPETSDEMLLDVILCAEYLPGDESIDIKSIIESDSLFIFPQESPLVTPSVNAVIGAYPNPFHDKLTISCELLSEADVRLSVYNAIGQKIRELSSVTEPAGIHSYEWDGRSEGGGAVAPGLYLYKLSIGSEEQVGKMMLSPKD